MKVALDANCFIDAANPLVPAYLCLQRLFSAASSGKVKPLISRHTLAELSKKFDAANELAENVEVLPHWPIGTIGEQVATIEQLSGTWEDARRYQEIQLELAQLAKSGNDIRDRGAYLDALGGKADFFVTSDQHLVGSGPAERIRVRFGLRVLTPCQLVSEVHL
jgi:predicted nucleic acid-binding protein